VSEQSEKKSGKIQIDLATLPRVVEELKLKVQMPELTDYGIARELSRKTRKRIQDNVVTRDISTVARNYPLVRKYVKTIEKTGYFALQQRKRLSTLPIRKQVDAVILRLLSQGVPLAVGNAMGGRAVGYRQVKRRFEVEQRKSHGSTDNIQAHSVVEVNPETLHLAEEIFQTYLDGGNMSQLFRNYNASQNKRRNLLRMIQNQLYIGKIIYKGNEFIFPQLAIIDKNLWQACQHPKDSERRFSGAKPLYGFVRRAGRWERTKDPDIIEKVKAVIPLRIFGVSYSEIADKEGLNWRQVFGIVNNPKYAGKVLVNGEPVDCGVEGFVSWTDWQKAHKTSAGLKSYEASRDTRRRQRTKKLQDLEDYIRNHQGARWSDLRTKYRKTSLAKYLKTLKLNGKIEKRDDKWYTCDVHP